MNKVILMGRLTRDPETRYSQGADSIAVTKYTLAINRKVQKNGENVADFFNCTAFGKEGEFAQKYFRKGMQVLVTGRMQQDNYTNKNGEKVYSIQIITETQEFADSKKPDAGGSGSSGDASGSSYSGKAGDGFMNIPDSMEDELPFN